MKTRTLLMAAAVMAVSSAAIAWPGDPPPPPPPPPELNDCSPGFWKNHTEFWFGYYCTGHACHGLLEGLRSRGPGSSETRLGIAGALNAWADAYYGTTICPNE